VLQESLAVFRDLKDVRGTAMALIGLGDVARDLGDSKRMAALSEEGLMLARACADTLMAGYALHNLGVAAWQQGDCAQAGSLFTIALTSLEPTVDGQAEVLASVGLMALGEAELAVRLFGAADAMRASSGTPIRSMLRERHDQDMAAARAALSPERFCQA
jgi:Flp pilus assembly protein TadD